MILTQNLRLGLAVNRRCADRDFDTVDGFNLTAVVARQVDALGAAVLEYRLAVADISPFGFTGADVAVSRQQNERRLFVPRFKRQFVPRVQLDDPERQAVQTAFADFADLGIPLCGVIGFLKVHSRSPSDRF